MPRIYIVNASLMIALLSVTYFCAATVATVNDVNVVGIVTDGSPVTDGGLDGSGFAYSATLLGTSISWAGSTFTLEPAGTSDAVSSTIIALPAGNDSAVNVLATAVNGNQPNQTFVVTYTDGTTMSFTQSLSDWSTPQSYPGESQVSAMAYRIAPNGAIDNGPFYLYGYSFAINSAKTVQSITLPNNRNVVVLGVVASLPVTGSAYITWSAPTQNTDGSPLTNLAGYVIQYGTSIASLNNQISIGSANSTNTEIENLSPGTWFFEIAAVNILNVEGQFSSIVSATIQ